MSEPEKREFDLANEGDAGLANAPEDQDHKRVKLDQSDKEDELESTKAEEVPDKETAESAEPEAEKDAEPEANPEATESVGADVEPEAATKQLTPLELAEQAAEDAKVECPPDLDSPGLVALPKNQQKFLLSAIRTIKRLKDASPFTVPVDPERLGIPTYFDYIKKPMDLSTIEQKLLGGQYASVKQVVDDFNQMVANAIIFNGHEAAIAQMGIALTAPLKRQLGNCPMPEDSAMDSISTSNANRESKKRRNTSSAIDDDHSAPSANAGNSNSGSVRVMHAPGVPMLRRESAVDGRPKREIHPPVRNMHASELRPRNKKTAAELKHAGQVLRDLLSRKHENIAYPFLQPVDPEALGVPDYFKIIKEPMDLGTIQTRLQEGYYHNGAEFESDVKLMFRNCYTFNPEGTPVAELGHRLEAVFDKRWNEKPAAAPTPPPMEEMRSDDSDYDDEYDEAGITNPAIKVLEDQLDLMRQQLHKLKREAIKEWRDKRNRKKSARGSTSGGAGARRSSHVGQRKSTANLPKDDPIHRTHITYEMKKELSEKISELPEKRLRRVVAIIQESMPQLAASGQEEIELDMDQLQPSTLRQLYDYVVRRTESSDVNGDESAAAKRALSGSASGVPQKKKKSKPLTEDEQSRQIEEIQNKLRQFEQRETTGDQTAAVSPASMPNGASGSAPAASTGGDYDSSSDEDEEEDQTAAGGRALVSFSDDSSSEED